MSKKAFTLIELLVVIAIIAILAAILFPVFARAKMAAKQSSDLSNTKQLGLGIKQYMADFDDNFPQAYYYRNDNGSSGAAPNCGYVHWSGMVQPYVKNFDVFKSPGDALGGLAPTNYDGNQQGAPAGQPDSSSCSIADLQAPRISYIPNSMLMPRKRRTIDPANVVTETGVDDVANTILIAPMTDIPLCINDSSAASGTDWKTHRSTNALYLSNGTTPFVGEAQADYNEPFYRAATQAQAVNALQQCQVSGAAGLSHLAYTSPYRFGGSKTQVSTGGANYANADGSSKFRTLGATLNQNNFLWGKRAYTAGGKEIRKSDGVTPVG